MMKEMGKRQEHVQAKETLQTTDLAVHRLLFRHRFGRFLSLASIRRVFYGFGSTLMATATAPVLHCSCAVRAPARAPGATTSKSLQKTSVRIPQARAWPSYVSGCRPRVSAQYRRGGGAGDFVAGFLLGGAIFGALGYILAPQNSKSLEEVDSVRDDRESTKRPARFLEDDEGLEKTQQNLNEMIAQLNAAIDNVSAQLRNEEGLCTLTPMLSSSQQRNLRLHLRMRMNIF